VPDLPRFDNAISFSRHTRQSAARSPRPRLLIFVVAYHAETTIDEVSTRILGTVLGPVARSHDGAVKCIASRTYFLICTVVRLNWCSMWAPTPVSSHWNCSMQA
jgi:hypothetical protein